MFLFVRALGVEVCLHSFFTSALDGGELLASQPRPLSLGERFPITHKMEELRAQKPVWTLWKTQMLPPADNQTTIPRSSSL
jgi:hypothetical protein